jgi:ABC-type multidrug transport system fused ATPase/permease subunit
LSPVYRLPGGHAVRRQQAFEVRDVVEERPAAASSQRVARLRLSCDKLRVEDVILETRCLTKEFPGFTAVQGVDLKIRRGTIHALIGPNGAGKTTVFNLLTKFLDPSAGEIL